MIHVQVVSRNRENLQALIRAAIADGNIIKSFEVGQATAKVRLSLIFEFKKLREK